MTSKESTRATHGWVEGAFCESDDEEASSGPSETLGGKVAENHIRFESTLMQEVSEENSRSGSFKLILTI